MALDEAGVRTFRKIFTRSRNAMLIADDERRYVDANQAACRLLGLSHAEVLNRTIDDFTPPEEAEALDDAWAGFMRAGIMSGTYTVLRPDGSRPEVDFSATAAIQPGRHLAILMELEPGSSPASAPDRPEAERRLTPREREVMGGLAVGETGEEVAARLDISPETVRNHVRNARETLGARTRAHAIALAIQRAELDL